MFSQTFFEVAFITSFFTIAAFYSIYLLILYYYYNNKNDKSSYSNPVYPRVSIIVPVYNESKTIHKKIRNIKEVKYPREKMEVLFVDGCSTDETPSIIEKHANLLNEDSIKVIRQERREGYNRGISQGIKNSTGNIIILTDAASYYEPDAIIDLVKHFSDPEVGAVTGREMILNKESGLAPMLEATYRSFYDFMRLAETEMDSTFDFKGEISAVRREICESLIPKVEGSSNASFDCCVPFQAKKEGYRAVFEKKAKYCELAPRTFKDRMRQQVRRGSILIGSMLSFSDMLMKKKYGKLGLIIMPAHLIMLTILPWAFLVGSVSLAIVTLINPAWLVVWAIVLASLLPAKTRLFLVSFVQSQMALIAAMWRVVMRRQSLFINTIPSTRA